MKPLIKYRGGKSKEIPYLKKHIPRFSGRYIEPFFGGGAMFFFLEPQRAIINNVNSKLIACYAGVKSNFETFRQELSEIEKQYAMNRKGFEELKNNTPGLPVNNKNETIYYQIRDMFNHLSAKKYSDALLYFFINKTASSEIIC